MVRKMRAVYILGSLLLWFTVSQVSAADKVEVTIDLSKQRMEVYVDGYRKYKWKVSTARKGYTTPVGDYKPLWTSRMHYSKKYDNAPMPYSIFFNGGYAIHGTNHTRRLGRTASHGCVRLHTNNARKLYNLVRKHGKTDMKIMVRRHVDETIVGNFNYTSNLILGDPELN
ncbi:MAG: L,D-transpeptidase [Gammaproteobacteria bacterium]|nr:L,D-transpeptidase [Gammaproteobacteria bacterium]